MLEIAGGLVLGVVSCNSELTKRKGRIMYIEKLKRISNQYDKLEKFIREMNLMSESCEFAGRLNDITDEFDLLIENIEREYSPNHSKRMLRWMAYMLMKIETKHQDAFMIGEIIDFMTERKNHD